MDDLHIMGQYHGPIPFPRDLSWKEEQGIKVLEKKPSEQTISRGAGLAGLIWYLTRPEPVSVTLYTVEASSVESTVANTRVGTVKSCRRTYLAPSTGSQVAKLTIKEGSRVIKNQILMVVWIDRNNRVTI